MRKALIVGIDHYEALTPLTGCVRDAYEVNGVLERHADGSLNFATPKLLTASSSTDAVSRGQLRDAIEQLFADDAEIALFYFAGHGDIDSTGGFIATSESDRADEGVPLHDILAFANDSPARNKVIVLDSCFSGIAAETRTAKVSEIADGTVILTASTKNQYADEGLGGTGGLFTNLFVDALHGSAADLVGNVSPGSVYAHVDQSLGTWDQRPVFKTNVTSFVSLRQCHPPIALNELLMLATLFPDPQHQFPVDPSFEPDRSQDQLDDPDIPNPDPANTATFKILQNQAKVNLVRPVDAEHMYFAAMNSTAVELTVLGQHYWRLAKHDLI